MEVPVLQGERAETVLESRLEYVEGAPVRVRLRKRGRRFDLRDDGRAVELAGRPPGWRELAVRLVERELSLNVSRDGVVFVLAVAGGLDLGRLAERVADASLALYQELLDVR
ncbi:MAG TPA: hypothetical protein VE753_10740 [Gaiellaceae bacterium]|nr:hypothetical protein [Gaiellaceae bacterium]